jgi:hypothetical protein
MTPRSTISASPSDIAEILTSLVATLEAMDRRMRVIESWVNEWEAADAWVEEQLIEHRDKTRDH